MIEQGFQFGLGFLAAIGSAMLVAIGVVLVVLLGWLGYGSARRWWLIRKRASNSISSLARACLKVLADGEKSTLEIWLSIFRDARLWHWYFWQKTSVDKFYRTLSDLENLGLVVYRVEQNYRIYRLASTGLGR